MMGKEWQSSWQWKPTAGTPDTLVDQETDLWALVYLPFCDSFPQGGACLLKVPPKPSMTAPPAESQLLKHMSLWGHFTFKA